MTPREQWKALRAPHVREAWSWKRTVHFWSTIGEERFLKTYEECRDYASKCVPTELQKTNFKFCFGHAINRLSQMREAERAGMDPLIWKLSQ